MSASILVTGATGFLGRHVVERLVASGSEVIATSLRGGEVGATQVRAVDLADRPAAVAALDGIECDALVHLAAALPADPSVEAMQAAFDATVAIDSTVAVLCRARRCRLVYASGTAVYGSTGEGLPASEERPPTPENLYAAAKVVGELLCAQHALITGAPATVLRISAPYGPGARRSTVVGTFLRRALASDDLELLGSGSRTQDFTYVGDAALAVSAALDNDAGGVINVATGRPVSMRELAEAALGAAPGSCSRIVSGGASDPQEGFRASYDVSKAERVLGWKATTSLADGLRIFADALREGS